MLFFIIAAIVFCSFILLLVKRELRSLLLCALCSTLFVFWFGILTYIAKKGGIGSDMATILFGPRILRTTLQYLRLTLGELGYIVAFGRYLFPPLMLWVALDFSYFNAAAWIKKRVWMLFVLPVVYLILYWPSVFEGVTAGGEFWLRLVVTSSSVWIWSYLILTVAVMLYEYRSITAVFFKRRFLCKSLLLASLAVLYAIFCPQDPAQIYLFYRNDYMWMLGLWYLSKGFNTKMYAAVGTISVVSAGIGFFSFLRYAQLQWDEEREEVTLKRKGREASQGISMFIHGTKNELLANRILICRLERSLSSAGLRNEDATAVASRLEDINEKLLGRMDKLYAAVKTDSLKLAPLKVNEIIRNAIEKFRGKYPDGSLVFELADEELLVMADMEHLSEALYNLMINAWEATLSASRRTPVEVYAHQERLWTSVTVKDNGMGIGKKESRRIWEPFYSNKNSSTNWGMGMYYVRSTVRSHLGSVRFESEIGTGTRFIVLLPKYGRI